MHAERSPRFLGQWEKWTSLRKSFTAVGNLSTMPGYSRGPGHPRRATYIFSAPQGACLKRSKMLEAGVVVNPIRSPVPYSINVAAAVTTAAVTTTTMSTTTTGWGKSLNTENLGDSHFL
ncbi:uncharacterized protein LOC130458418 [Monodelphis domestica]|uniref:uncharacterized protein LOC130458418 n=1 Tax=Monodelphis domestica TaxID=13616 RepID=UPI0024E26094|nr:uncharacterized protein LOC130458418 [Monodelphis domestica]